VLCRLFTMCSIALSLHTLTRLLSPEQQGDVVLKPHVASACFKCFKCFGGMLQVFYIDIAKVDRDVAHVAMVFSNVCPKCFICFSVCCNCFIWILQSRSGCCIYIHVASVCFKCFLCFIRMLHMFCNDYTRVFLVFQMYVASVSTISDVCYRVFHLCVAKVNLMLHMLHWDLATATTCGNRGGASGRRKQRSGRRSRYGPHMGRASAGNKAAWAPM
jgi:hypothetical protein